MCRSLDCRDEQLRISKLLIAICGELNIAVHRLPSISGTRFGVLLDDDSDRLNDLLGRLGHGRVVCRRREVELRNNLYEFDQVTTTSPERAIYFDLRPRPHCRTGVEYLRDRVVTLELLESQGDAVVVPRPARGPRVYGREQFAALEVEQAEADGTVARWDWPYPVDLVYTWVDADDPHWVRLRAQLSGQDMPEELPVAAANAARWHSRDELRYSLRSAWMYAPFVNHIYIVTNGQVPTWLTADAMVTVVRHEEIYPDPADLPTFNSNHIETVLHRIDGLSEHFLYLNDDFFFAGPVTPDTFLTRSGLCRIFRTTRYLDDRPVTQHDRATVAAHKNTRDALSEKLGYRPSQKFKHAPYVMRRSVWYEIERIFAEELQRTRRNRFRSFDDLNGQFLYCHYALATGSGVASKIPYAYVEVLDEALEEALERLESKRYKVFCLNDANSTAQNVDRHSDRILSFFEKRFPVEPSWEVSSPVYRRGGDREGELLAIGSQAFEAEVRLLTPSVAEQKYRAAIARGQSARVAKRLIRLLRTQGRANEALEFVPSAYRDGVAAQLAELDIRSGHSGSTSDLAHLVPHQTPAMAARGLAYLGRTVETEADFEVFRAVVADIDPAWRFDVQLLKRSAAAARRAGLASEARCLLEVAAGLSLSMGQRGRSVKQRREEQPIVDAWRVVDDLHEVAQTTGTSIFADAGTLLGFVRDGAFIPHDYDVDFAIRSSEEFSRFTGALATDWRFDVTRARTPDLIMQARHASGTLVDVFLHRREGSQWVKRSHVYGWRFDDFDLGCISIAGRRILVPDPSEKYLEQMYGSDWMVPQSGFDSRLDAPNRFFPDRDEIVCTILNKIVDAAMHDDIPAIRRYLSFLDDSLDYTLPDKSVADLEQ